jgi:hypothetical protein
MANVIPQEVQDHVSNNNIRNEILHVDSGDRYVSYYVDNNGTIARLGESGTTSLLELDEVGLNNNEEGLVYWDGAHLVKINQVEATDIHVANDLILGNSTNVEDALVWLKHQIDALPDQIAVATYDDLPSTADANTIAHVSDASGDSNVESGWAKYQFINGAWELYLTQGDTNVVALTDTEVADESSTKSGTISGSQLAYVIDERARTIAEMEVSRLHQLSDVEVGDVTASTYGLVRGQDLANTYLKKSSVSLVNASGYANIASNDDSTKLVLTKKALEDTYLRRDEINTSGSISEFINSAEGQLFALSRDQLDSRYALASSITTVTVIDQADL